MSSSNALKLRVNGLPRTRNRHVSRRVRAAGAGLLLLTAVLYLVIGGTPWIGLALLLVPDVAAIGFLFSARVGVATYNTAHRPLYPAALLALGLLVGWRAGMLSAVIWLAHIGMDRAAGYGLKDATPANGERS